MISVFDVDVLVSDVVDEAVADVRASPSLQSSAILAIEKCYILNPGIGYVVFHTGILADRAHRYAVSTIAPEILDENVGRVRLGAEAIVANVNTGIGHSQAIDIESVEAISILGQRGSVCADGADVDVIKDDVVGADHESCPAWRVFQMQASDLDVRGILSNSISTAPQLF